MSKRSRDTRRSADTKRSAATARKTRPKQPLASDRPEKMSQFTLKMRASLHRELARLAFESNMTMRGFIMNALKSKGLSITKADLVDRRRR
jgi:hypothetical protein